MHMDSRVNRHKRLPREEREHLILEEAIRFFAEVGFEGQTRALAERIGVTQPLLYRYFPDKETLIERVFDEVYLKRWRPEWASLLRDRKQPMVERLISFYKIFCTEIFTPQWVRLFMFAGLKGERINERYLAVIRRDILEPIAEELRVQSALPSAKTVPISEAEINLIWALHGAIFYITVRKWIYKLPIPDDIGPLIELTVRSYLNGFPTILQQLIKKS